MLAPSSSFLGHAAVSPSPRLPSTTAHSNVKTYFLSSFFVSFVFIVFACLTNILPLDNERKAKQQTSRAESSAPKTTILYNHQEWICLGIDSPSSWWNASCCCTPAARLSSILWAPHGHRAQAPTRHCVGLLSFCYGGFHNICSVCRCTRLFHLQVCNPLLHANKGLRKILKWLMNDATRVSWKRHRFV